VVAGAGLAALAVLAGGAYIYFFSGLRTAPAQLGLSATPTATPTTTGSTPSPPAVLTGNWTVTTGSIAGYRVKELFAGQSSKHEAVARTSTVSGSLTVSGDSTGYKVSDVTITVGLADLQSKDQVAGRDVSQRDGIVSRQLNVQRFPTATFTVVSASVAAAVTSGPVDVTAVGQLTIHGVTKDVTVKAKAQVAGDKVEIAGSIAITMTDYGVLPPQAPFVTVDTALTLEFDIFMTKATSSRPRG
jgi:polyisoprenoid-binding protein YceI